MNIFERAARAKLKFQIANGLWAVEDIFDLPLTAVRTTTPCLDNLAKDIHRQLKDFGEVSFVETDKPDPGKVQLELQKEIVLHIIKSKQEAAKAAETREQRASLRRQLTDALNVKKGEEINKLSVEELQKKLDELDAQ